MFGDNQFDQWIIKKFIDTAKQNKYVRYGAIRIDQNTEGSLRFTLPALESRGARRSTFSTLSEAVKQAENIGARSVEKFSFTDAVKGLGPSHGYMTYGIIRDILAGFQRTIGDDHIAEIVRESYSLPATTGRLNYAESLFRREGKAEKYGLPFAGKDSFTGLFFTKKNKITGDIEELSTREILDFMGNEYNFHINSISNKLAKRTRILTNLVDFDSLEKDQFFKAVIWDPQKLHAEGKLKGTPLDARINSFYTRMREAGFSDKEVDDAFKAMTDGSVIIHKRVIDGMVARLKTRAEQAAKHNPALAQTLRKKAAELERQGAKGVYNARISGMVDITDQAGAGNMSAVEIDRAIRRGDINNRVFGIAKGDFIVYDPARNRGAAIHQLANMLGIDRADVIMTNASLTEEAGFGAVTTGARSEETGRLITTDEGPFTRVFTASPRESSPIVFMNVESFTSHPRMWDMDRIAAYNQKETEYIGNLLRQGKMPPQIEGYLKNAAEVDFNAISDLTERVAAMKRAQWANKILDQIESGLPLANNPDLMNQILKSYEENLIAIGKSKWRGNPLPGFRIPGAFRAHIQSNLNISLMDPEAVNIAEGEMRYSTATESFHMSPATFEALRKEAFGGADLDDALEMTLMRNADIADVSELGAIKVMLQRMPNTMNEAAYLNLSMYDPVFEDILKREAFAFGDDAEDVEKVIQEVRKIREAKELEQGKSLRINEILAPESSLLERYKTYVNRLVSDKRIGAVRQVSWNQAVANGTIPKVIGQRVPGEIELISQAEMIKPFTDFEGRQVDNLYSILGSELTDLFPFHIPPKEEKTVSEDIFGMLPEARADKLVDEMLGVATGGKTMGFYQNSRMVLSQWMTFNQKPLQDAIKTAQLNGDQQALNFLDSMRTGVLRQEEAIDALINAPDANKVTAMRTMGEDIQKSIGALSAFLKGYGHDTGIDALLLKDRGDKELVAQGLEAYNRAFDAELTMQDITLLPEDEGSALSRAASMFQAHIENFKTMRKSIVGEIQLPEEIIGTEYTLAEQKAAQDFIKNFRDTNRRYREFFGGNKELMGLFSDVETAEMVDEDVARNANKLIRNLSKETTINDTLKELTEYMTPKGKGGVTIDRLYGALLKHIHTNKYKGLGDIRDLLFGGYVTDTGISVGNIFSKASESLVTQVRRTSGSKGLLTSSNYYEEYFAHARQAITESVDTHALGGSKRVMEADEAFRTAQDVMHSNVGKGVYERITKGGIGKLLKNPIARVSAGALGAMALAGLVYGKVKDRAPEEMEGPPLLPGGSAYENYDMVPPMMQSMYPSTPFGSSGSQGYTYRINATGASDHRALANKIQSLTGGTVNSTIYQGRPQLPSPADLMNQLMQGG